MTEIDQPSRYLLTSVILLAACRLTLNTKIIWAGFIASAFGAGLFALYQITSGGITRAEGFLNPIFFGEVALIIGFITLTSIGIFRRKETLIIVALAFLCATIANFLSGTRGGWIALPLLLVIFFKFNTHIPKKNIVLGLIVLSVFLLTLYLIPQTGVSERLNNAVVEYKHSFNANSYGSAIGHRIELWRVGLSLFCEHPIFGWGEIGLVQQKNYLIDQGLFSEKIRLYTHLHSIYIDRLARYGVIGFVSFLLVLALPLRYFLKHINNIKCRPYCLSGVLLVTSYLVFSLTDVLLDSEIGILTYNIMMVTMISLTNSALKSCNKIKTQTIYSKI